MTQINDPQTGAIIGTAMYVHRVLSYGFLEQVYQDAFEIELKKREIPYEREAKIPVMYDGIELDSFYRADFVCYDSIIVELKALSEITSVEIAQVLNYLKATGYNPGLLLNFGAQSLQFHRIRNKFI